MTTIASAHCPLINETSIVDAFDIARSLPSIPAPPAPDQALLDAVLNPTVS